LLSFAALRFAPFGLGRPAFAALPLTPNHSIKHNLESFKIQNQPTGHP
jgi:hypothetical protein